MAGQGGGDLGEEFARFIAWRDAQRQAEREQDFEVPIFEKLPDGTERSATLPFSQAKHQLASWWPDLRDVLGLGEGEGGSDGGSGQAPGGKASGGGAPGPIAQLFGGGGQARQGQGKARGSSG